MDLEFFHNRADNDALSTEEVIRMVAERDGGYRCIDCSHVNELPPDPKTRGSTYCVYVETDDGDGRGVSPIHCCNKCGRQLMATVVALGRGLVAYKRATSMDSWNSHNCLVVRI